MFARKSYRRLLHTGLSYGGIPTFASRFVDALFLKRVFEAFSLALSRPPEANIFFLTPF